MKLLHFLLGASLSVKVHFFFRTAHPDVKFHQDRLSQTKKDLLDQVAQLKDSESHSVKVDTLHESRESYYSDFLVVNALPYIESKIAPDVDWVFIGEETTTTQLDFLLELLHQEKTDQPQIIGRGLFDREPVIIHHFFGVQNKAEDYRTFPFPDFDAGFVLNRPLIRILVSKLGEWRSRPEFQIDPKHEFARYIKKHAGIQMKESKNFCAGNWHRTQKTCYTRAGKELPDCGLTPNEKVFVAVKTTEKFHKDRLKVVKKTWGPKFDNIIYYSNVTDSSIPTVISGPNTERGHCQKLYFILKEFLKKKEFDWLYVADDDTICSAYRLHRITACYDHKKPVFIGERYGYGLNTGNGYPYITGGGGMLFSRAAVEQWKKNGCQCPQPDSPDDMMIGSCYARSRTPLVHLNTFHQARPDDYSEGYLDNNTPLSFHKHWNCDPVQIYANWFGLDDSEWWSTKAHDHETRHVEL